MLVVMCLLFCWVIMNFVVLGVGEVVLWIVIELLGVNLFVMR